MTLEEIIAALQQASTDLQAILDAEQPSVAQLDQADEIVKTIAELEGKKAKAERMLEVKAANQARLSALNTPINKVPSATKTTAVATSFARKSKIYADNETAFKAGRFFQAVIGHNEEAKAWCEGQGINFKTLQSGVEGGAGLFIIPEIETAVIRLVEEYGIIRKYAKTITTKSNTHTIWKRASGNTAYFLTEMGQPTSTDAAWSTLTLTPKILGALTKYSLILEADAAINLADQITQELAFQLAIKEDQCAFIGDGTSTYGGIVGLNYAFQKTLQDGGGTWTTDADKSKLGGAVLAAGNLFSEFTLQNFIDTKNKVARYPGMKPSWFIHDVAAAASMERLIYAITGGQNPSPVDGLPPKFLGYPVVYVNAMPSADANSQVACLFGDLSMASIWCDRQGMEIATNTQSETNFLTRTAQVLATERFDFIVHDSGNYHATAASRTRGAVSALISMNS